MFGLELLVGILLSGGAVYGLYRLGFRLTNQ
jgi:hypothetical protein